MSDLYQKFSAFKDNNLNDYTPEAQEKILGLEKSLKRALLADNLLDHDGVKMLLEKYEVEIKNINSLLMTKVDMEEIQRLFLFERKDWCQQLLSYFDSAKSTIETIGKLIDETTNQS